MDAVLPLPEGGPFDAPDVTVVGVGACSLTEDTVELNRNVTGLFAYRPAGGTYAFDVDVSVSSGSAQTGNNQITFDAPGSVTFTGKVGTDTSQPKTVKVVGVKSVSVNNATILAGATVQATATPDPEDASWPSGKPAWTAPGGSVSGSGGTVSITYSAPGAQTVSASCGNTKDKEVIVLGVGAITGKSHVSPGDQEAYSVTCVPDGQAFPAGQPVWTTNGSSLSSGNSTVNLTFGTNDVTLSVSCGTSTTNKLITVDLGDEYSPLPAIQWGLNDPAADGVMASPGEKLTFNLWGRDSDSKRSAGSDNWTTNAASGPHDLEFELSGDADFNSANSGDKTKSVPGAANADIQSGNVYVCIRPTWNTNQTIQVKVKVVDKEAGPTALATGSITDTFTRTWTISARSSPPPTGLKKTSGAADSVWVANRSDFTYLGMPDQPNRSRPFYQGHTVQESFSMARPLFGIEDLNFGIKDQEHLESENDVKSWVSRTFTPGSNSSFVLDSADQFNDAHAGIIDPKDAYYIFTLSCLKEKRAGVAFDQTYTCAGKDIGKAIVKFVVDENKVVQINKQHIGIP